MQRQQRSWNQIETIKTYFTGMFSLLCAAILGTTGLDYINLPGNKAEHYVDLDIKRNRRLQNIDFLKWGAI